MEEFLIQYAETIDIVSKLLLASFLGGLVGIQRDIHRKAAGLRTHILVTAGSALFTILSIEFGRLGAPDPTLLNEPSRLASQIVTGIGFIGAGTIMKSGFNIHGITTAASLWMVAAIGIAAGMGQFAIATFATLVCLSTLVMLEGVERWYVKYSYRKIHIVIKDRNGIIKQLYEILEEHATIQKYKYDNDFKTKTIHVDFVVCMKAKGMVDPKFQELIQEIEAKVKGIQEIRWEEL